MRNDFLTATKNTPSPKWLAKKWIHGMREKGNILVGRGFRPGARSPQSLWVVALATTKTPQNPAASAAEAPPSRFPHSLFSRDINRSGYRRLRSQKYRFCLVARVLTAGTLRRFSFCAPAHFHLRSPHNFAAAFRFLAPRVAPSSRQLPPSRRRPTQLVCLPSARPSQRIRRNILSDRGSRRDVRAIPNPHRRHQRAITPDENPIADRGFVLGHAIVVTSNRP